MEVNQEDKPKCPHFPKMSSPPSSKTHIGPYKDNKTAKLHLSLVGFKRTLLPQAKSRFTDLILQQKLTKTGQIALQAHSQYSFCTLLRDEPI